MVGENVAAHPTDQAHGNRGSAQLARRAGLIGPFAAGDHLKIAAQHGLAGHREAVDRHHEVHVQAADDYQGGYHLAIIWRHLARSMPSFFSSSE